MNDRLLITGGSGFIGTHFHHFLKNQSVINLDLQTPGHSLSTFVQGDIREKKDIKKAVHGNNIKTILSLAAKHHDFGIGHDEYFDTNEEGTKKLCEVASEYGIKEFIFYSSVAVYGLSENISNETTNTSPDSPYGASKLAGENVLIKWAEEDATRKVLIIRPTVVFGSLNRANMFSLIRQIDSGLYFKIGGADKIKSIAYVENLVQATVYLKDRLKPGVSIYNYADEPQLTTHQISQIIADRLNKKVWLTIPRTLAILIGLPFDIIIKLTGKNLPVSTARIKKLGTQTYHSANKIFSEGFQPKYSTTEGLQKMVDWYKTLNR